jgi:hypothetical protein
MVKDCACKKCAKVNKRPPTHEEALRHGKVLDEAKRKSVAISPGLLGAIPREDSKR